MPSAPLDPLSGLIHARPKRLEGVANPTLTIVALTIRLADHLKQGVGAARVG